MARIDLRDVSKALTEAGKGTFNICDVTLRVPDGHTMVVLGPSGCGKTTLLKLIAGLLTPDAGHVRYNDVDMAQVPPGKRRIGMVFQNYALYPHVTARTNVLSYYLFRKKTPALNAEARARFERTSELMGVELAYLFDRKPTTLSGGEKQRIALGRCITRDAAVFLVDEPFANLDQALREKYRVNLKRLLREFRITTVYVTHDHHEALLLADLLAIMERGRVAQVGTPQEIYEAPKTMFVAGFLNMNAGAPPISLIDGRQLPWGEALANMWVGVRPEHVEMSRTPHPDALKGTITDRLTLPPRQETLISIRVGEDEVHAGTAAEAAPPIGAEVWLTFKRYHVFDKASGRRLSSHGG
ncbi:MAG TPA: ABC transporter ATP-binding protein [Hyphomicrobiaceae bacterium]|nr:ABC transporter ATP-binding protein [Hyphomicrobiaceae bacterium]